MFMIFLNCGREYCMDLEKTVFRLRSKITLESENSFRLSTLWIARRRTLSLGKQIPDSDLENLRQIEDMDIEDARERAIRSLPR